MHNFSDQPFPPLEISHFFANLFLILISYPALYVLKLTPIHGTFISCKKKGGSAVNSINGSLLSWLRKTWYGELSNLDINRH